MSSFNNHLYIHYIMHTMPILQSPALDRGGAELAGPWLASLYCQYSVDGCSSWIDRTTSSIEPGSVFIHTHLTIWAVATCLGLMLGYVRLLQLFKARSRGDERQLLILAWLHRLFSGLLVTQDGLKQPIVHWSSEEDASSRRGCICLPPGRRSAEPGFIITAYPQLFHSLQGAG